jgi:hypothetical protein
MALYSYVLFTDPVRGFVPRKVFGKGQSYPGGIACSKYGRDDVPRGMYHKPKYGKNDSVWVDRGAEQPLEGQVLRYLGGRTYEVAISDQGVRVIQEQALSLRTKGENR